MGSVHQFTIVFGKKGYLFYLVLVHKKYTYMYVYTVYSLAQGRGEVGRVEPVRRGEGKS
jgi:hypothetical protein